MPFPFPHLHGKTPLPAPPPPPPPPGPTKPNWDYLLDRSSWTRTGGGVVTIEWGITIISIEVGPPIYNPAAAGSFDVVLLNGEVKTGLFFASVADAGNGSDPAGGYFSWTATSNPM